MLYRRKILLSILHTFGGQLTYPGAEAGVYFHPVAGIARIRLRALSLRLLFLSGQPGSCCHDYINYPFYAINSTIAAQLLNARQLEQVDAERVSIREKRLFTIGYEGKSLEQYINQLLREDVKLL